MNLFFRSEKSEKEKILSRLAHNNRAYIVLRLSRTPKIIKHTPVARLIIHAI